MHALMGHRAFVITALARAMNHEDEVRRSEAEKTRVAFREALGAEEADLLWEEAQTLPEEQYVSLRKTFGDDPKVFSASYASLETSDPKLYRAMECANILGLSLVLGLVGGILR